MMIWILKARCLGRLAGLVTCGSCPRSYGQVRSIVLLLRLSLIICAGLISGACALPYQAAKGAQTAKFSIVRGAGMEQRWPIWVHAYSGESCSTALGRVGFISGFETEPVEARVEASRRIFLVVRTRGIQSSTRRNFECTNMVGITPVGNGEYELMQSLIGDRCHVNVKARRDVMALSDLSFYSPSEGCK
jgi:hypothetical protein